MKIAICIGQSVSGGVGTSTYILAKWFRNLGHQADIIITHFNPGSDYQRAVRDSWPVKAINIDERWLRRRLENTLETLSNYHFVINNHSPETSLVLPAIPANTVSISVARTTDTRVISQVIEKSKFVDGVVGISPPVTEQIQIAGAETLIKTIPNSVILKANELPVLGKPLRIVFLGRLGNREKNVLILPSVAEAIHRLGVEFSLMIIGDGPEKESLEKMIDEKGLGEHISMLGSMDRETAWNALKTAHFSLVPSIFEGFGLVVAESMAAGVVPICSDIDVFKWLLGTHSEQLTVPLHDAEAYARKIKSIAENPEEYISLQKELRQRQKEFFSPEKMVSSYLDFFYDIKNNFKISSKHSAVGINGLSLSRYHRIRCTRLWRVLQMLRYG